VIVPLTITVPALVGAGLYFQELFVDTGAPQGFSPSDGLAVVLG